MAHEIEIFEDGSAGFVSAREHAWHRLGTVLPDGLTAEDAMFFANLGGWNVRKAPVYAVDPVTGESLDTNGGIYAPVRTNPVTGKAEVIGRNAVGEIWEPVQNEEHCELLNTLVDDSGAHFETAGSLRGGAQVFVTMRMPETMMIGGKDRVDLYIAGLNSHDGTGSFTLLATPVRIVCANTQAMAMRNFESKFVIRHTTSAKAKIEEARTAMRLSFKWADEFQRQANAMIDEELKTWEFNKILTRLIPAPDAPAESRKAKNHAAIIDALQDLWTGSDTLGDIKGTRWAGYQVITEWTDHFKGPQDSRALNAIQGRDVAELKTRAFQAFSVKALQPA